jgi:hypothetical protein
MGAANKVAARTIFSDPLKVAEKHPDLRTALFEWIDEQKPRPWDRTALDDFLASYAYEVKVGPNVWGVYFEGFQIRANGYAINDKFGQPVDPALGAYKYALSLLENEVRLADELIRERVKNVREASQRPKVDIETMLNL